jgi:hypothetical protein
MDARLRSSAALEREEVLEDEFYIIEEIDNKGVPTGRWFVCDSHGNRINGPLEKKTALGLAEALNKWWKRRFQPPPLEPESDGPTPTPKVPGI